MSGKGSGRRPCDEEKVRNNWDNIFGKKEPKTLAEQVFEDQVKPYAEALDRELIKGNK